ncbi:hypothetical protein AVEN_215023-1, partial [Araneus ventricosus]
MGFYCRRVSINGYFGNDQGSQTEESSLSIFLINENDEESMSTAMQKIIHPSIEERLIIGLKIEGSPDTFQKLKLSQILSMYYGPTGLLDKDDVLSRSNIQWCEREKNFDNIRTVREEIYKFFLLYTNYLGAIPTENAQDEVNEIIGSIQKSTEVFNDIA